MLSSRKALTVVLLISAALLMLPACNMVKGAGEDISAIAEGGQQIIDEATRP